ncbi:hypothetical protein VTJ04DRAFT_10261 [Mycothermus thermophilus]|uniref:uncharacterized protein n=1 Tax=Humicola insolens TaxID=85995 RepID=UPI0037422AFB
MNYKLTEMLKDAEKFVDHHEWVIHWNPVQIYGTALGFSPALSKVRHQYWKERLPFIDNIAGIQENWDDGGQTPKGRRNEVNAVTFSPDGKTLASCSDNTTIRLWDPKTGACHQTLEGHTDWVKAVAFSPNGKTLASASKDKTIRLWDTITGTCQQTLKGHTGCIGTVVFSPDGKTLASGSNDTTIRLWDLEIGTCQQTLNGHTDWVRTVVFSPDGMVLASGSDDGTIRLWDPLTGMCQQTLEHVYGVTAVAVSPDGKRLASALIFDETIRLWDLETGECEQMLRVSGEISTLVFYRDGQCLETNRGLLSLEFDASSGYGPAEPAETGALFVGRDWITWDGKRLLWIRWYRTKCVAVYGHTVVLGDEAGQVVFIRFSFPE